MNKEVHKVVYIVYGYTREKIAKVLTKQEMGQLTVRQDQTLTDKAKDINSK